MQTKEGKDGLTKKELKTSLWLALHRTQLRLFGYIVLSSVTAVFVGLFIVVLVRWVSNIQLHNSIVAELSQPLVNYDAAQRPDTLVIKAAVATFHDDSSIDIAVQIENVNPRWGADSATVEIFMGGKSAGQQQMSFAPGQQSVLVKTNLPYTGTTVPAISAVITKVDWKAYRNPLILPQAEWEFSNAAFRRISSTANNSLFQSELSFDIRNRSVLGFREPEVNVLMYTPDGSIQAIGHLTLDRIESLETRTLTFRWPAALQANLQPEIIVNTDLLNEEQIIR